MQNFNLQVGTERSKPFIKLLCQPIRVVDQQYIWIFFEGEGQESVIELLGKIREVLGYDNREYGYSIGNGCHTIKTTFQDFNRLVFYLQGKGFICRDNYGGILKPVYPEIVAIFKN